MLETATSNSTSIDMIQSVRGHAQEFPAEKSTSTKQAITLLDREKIKSDCKSLLETVRLANSKRTFSEISSQNHSSQSSQSENPTEPLPKKLQKLNENIINQLRPRRLSSTSNDNSQSPHKQQIVPAAAATTSFSSFSDLDDVDDQQQSDINSENQSGSMECFEDPISVEENSIEFPPFELDQFIEESVDSVPQLFVEVNIEEAHADIDCGTDENEAFARQNIISAQSPGILDGLIPGNERVLVLDLDNTLVHSFLGTFIGGFNNNSEFNSDPTISFIPTQELDQRLMVKRRAFLEQFLKLAFENFQVVMYTLGSVTYARAVHEIFKQKMPAVFSNHAFLKIIAQSATRQPGQQNVEKNISKYFSHAKFSNRLLVLDDNQQVYHEEWQRNIIYTKPFKFWNIDDPIAALCDFNPSSEEAKDYFLFYAHKLLSGLLVADPNKDRIVCAYNEQLMSILSDERILVANPQNQSAAFLAMKMGASLIDESENPTATPTTIVQDNEQEEQREDHEKDEDNHDRMKPMWMDLILSRLAEDQRNTIDVVSEQWLKYCYCFAVKIPKSLWNSVKDLPNFETALASLI